MALLADAFNRIDETRSMFDDHLDRSPFRPISPTDPWVPVLRHNQKIRDHYAMVLDHLAVALLAAVNQYQHGDAEEREPDDRQLRLPV